MMSQADIRAALRARLRACDLCPNACGVDRSQGQTGLCGVDDSPAVYQNFMHYGEERTLVPAFVINLCGCGLSCPTCPERCRFGQKRLPTGSPEHYAAALKGYFERRQMPKSLEWIGGEPSAQILFVLETSWALKAMMPDGPRIYLNTNGYFDIGLLDMMAGAIDGFVFDLKCAPACTGIVGGHADYYDVVTGVIARAYALYPEHIIIRHLVMPGHVSCCTAHVLDWCVAHVPGAAINLMTGFENFETGASLSAQDRADALDLMRRMARAGDMINGEWVNGH